jgi:YidC/Oxa1 family membrane protein insertase
MSFLSNFFYLVLYQPIFNLLIFFDFLFKDFGVAIIFLTLLIRVLLFPLSQKTLESQKAMADLQPELKKVQEKYKEDKEKQAQAIVEVYKKAKINPLASIFLLFLQLPILIALYRVFWRGFEADQFSYLYSFTPHASQINPNFLGFFNLSQGNLLLAILAGLTQFWQSKISLKPDFSKSPKRDFATIFQRQAVFVLPFFTFTLLVSLPSALSLYIIITNLFSIFEQLFFKRKIKHGKT